MSRSKAKKARRGRCPLCGARKPEDRPWVLVRNGRVIGRSSALFGGLVPCPDPFHEKLGKWLSPARG